MVGGVRTFFTQGGFSYFDLEAAKKEKLCPYWTTDFQDSVDFQLHDGRKGYFGWMGYGGSIFQWHPEMDIGFSYVPLDVFLTDASDRKGATLQGAMRDCVMNLEGKNKA